MTIFLHQIINHTDTPIEVVSLLCKHELLHLQIGSAVINGRKTDHSPEFWEAEKRIASERIPAWTWIWTNLSRCLKRRPRLERIDVLPNWREVWNCRKLSIAECNEICSSTPLTENEETGW